MLRLGVRISRRGRDANRMLQRKHKIHFVGIGGIGMSGIAEVLLNLGFR